MSSPHREENLPGRIRVFPQVESCARRGIPCKRCRNPFRSSRKWSSPPTFPEFAAVALLRAANLALRMQATIVLAHVIDPISLAAGSDGAPFVVEEEDPLDQLEAAAHPLRECGIPYSIFLRSGDIRDELSRLVQEEQADLTLLRVLPGMPTLTPQSNHAAVVRLESVAKENLPLTRTVHCVAQNGELGETIARPRWPVTATASCSAFVAKS